MRHIPTSDARVEQLKKEAKRLQRKSGGKHAEALNKVANKAGYDHWHHVTLCAGQPERAKGEEEVGAAFNGVIDSSKRREAKVILTSGKHGLGPYLVFSTTSGDAWVLDPDGFGAGCLMWKGEVAEGGMDGGIHEAGWAAQYELLGDFFRVESELPGIGDQIFADYPVAEIRAAIEKAQSFESKFAMTIGKADAVEMTPDVMARMVKRGWSEEELLTMKSEGFLYSPGRDSLIGPTMSSDDEEFQDSEFDQP